MTNSRLEEIQRMFDEMGLGRPEDRRHFSELAGDSIVTKETAEETPKEQQFIRLGNNTLEGDEV